MVLGSSHHWWEYYDYSKDKKKKEREIRKKKGYVATLLKEKTIGVPEVMSKPKDFTNQR